MGGVEGRRTDGRYDEFKIEDDRTFPVTIQDQYTDVVDLLLCNQLNPATLAAPIVRGASTATFVPGHGFVSGNTVCIKEGARFYQATVINVATDVITVDSPFDFAFTVAAGVERRRVNMAVDGSVTPVVFSVTPPVGTEWDLTRMIIQATDDSAMDDGKFAGITALTKGLLFRVVNGNWKNIFNAKTNGDFRLRTFDVAYLDAALGPSGLYGFGCRRSFNGFDKNGVTIRLGPDDEFQAVVQDNLSGISSLRVCVQGHVVD